MPRRGSGRAVRSGGERPPVCAEISVAVEQRVWRRPPQRRAVQVPRERIDVGALPRKRIEVLRLEQRVRRQPLPTSDPHVVRGGHQAGERCLPSELQAVPLRVDEARPGDDREREAALERHREPSAPTVGLHLSQRVLQERAGSARQRRQTAGPAHEPADSVVHVLPPLSLPCASVRLWTVTRWKGLSTFWGANARRLAREHDPSRQRGSSSGQSVSPGQGRQRKNVRSVRYHGLASKTEV